MDVAPKKVAAAQGLKEMTEGWPFMWWIVGCVSLTVTIPWLIFWFLGSVHLKCSKSKLKDKVVMITGASSGLGEALAHSFYKCGCRVILAARRQEELERVRNDLLATHVAVPTHPPVVLPLDLSDLNSLPERIAQALAISGHIDILVHNGGVGHRGDILTTNVDVAIKIMMVNYFGQMALTKAILPSMIERHSGHIVVVSSVQGKIAIPYRSAYAASKHALQAFNDSLRAEVAQHNIKVSVISPGYIATAISVNALTGSGIRHGEVDKTTESGYKPEYAADQILSAVAEGKKEFIITQLSSRIAIPLRTFMPSLYFWIMEKRARNNE